MIKYYFESEMNGVEKREFLQDPDRIIPKSYNILEM